MGSTVIGGITYPESTNAPVVPSDLRQMAEQIELNAVPRFASAAERTAAFATLGTSPTTGMVCYRNDAGYHEWYNGTTWIALTGSVGIWVPVLSNLTLGSGTVRATYRQIGKWYDFHFRFTYGAGSAVGTDPSFTLPATPSADYPTEAFGTFPGRVHLLDSGTAGRPGALTRTGTATVAIGQINATPAVAQITATSPWTWTTPDALIVDGGFYTD